MPDTRPDALPTSEAYPIQMTADQFDEVVAKVRSDEHAATVAALAQGGDAAIRDAIEELVGHNIDCAVDDTEGGSCDCGVEGTVTAIIARIAAQRAADQEKIRGGADLTCDRCKAGVCSAHQPTEMEFWLMQQRAAEAARVREETLQAACKAQCLHCETGLPTERHDYWPFKHFHRHPEDQALTMECAAWRIRALREAPRG